jgi:hypothetical protein
MTARFPHPSARNTDSDASRLPLDDAIPARDPVVGLAGRACCCPARAMVRVIMSPTPARPHETDLMLCGHHYRVSQRALAAARAEVSELPGTPDDTAAWIRSASQAAPARSDIDTRA